ncbi:MAG: ATP-binding cassette domain-containing protein [Rubrobacteraceae bacterium]
MGEAVIQTVEQAKQFGKQPAVSSLDTRVEGGSVHGLLGPDDAGKTTLLKLVNGLLRPTN